MPAQARSQSEGSARARDPAHIERGTSTAVGRNVAYRIHKASAHVAISGTWLDCGCADGGYTAALIDAGAKHVVGTDVEEARIAEARFRWSDNPATSFEVAAAEELPFPDNSFDGVFFNEVLEHVRDEARSLTEIRRILRPGGTLIALVPNRYFPFEGHGMRLGARRLDVPVPILPWLPWRLSRRFMRARNYWPSEVRQLIQEQGFNVIGQESVFPIFEVYGRLPRGLLSWYWRNLARIERIPVIRRFGVSTLVAATKPDGLDSIQA
jgi:ubiquinone/menaquinone biosynthesis C-methylase UbiE